MNYGLFLLLVGLLFWGKMAAEKERVKYRIKYDSRDRKLLWWIAISSTILSVILIVFSTLSIMDDISIEIATIILAGGFLFFPMLAFIAWNRYVCSFLYLKRLKKYGYEIPLNKKLFASKLENLRKMNGQVVSLGSLSKESLVMAVVSFIIFIGFIINTFDFYLKYRAIGDLEEIGVYGSIPLLLFWLINSFVYWRQRLRDKYRDDVEIDRTRKMRKHIEEGLVEICIFLFLSIIYIFVLHNFINFMYKSRLQAGFYQ